MTTKEGKNAEITREVAKIEGKTKEGRIRGGKAEEINPEGKKIGGMKIGGMTIRGGKTTIRGGRINVEKIDENMTNMKYNESTKEERRENAATMMIAGSTNARKRIKEIPNEEMAITRRTNAATTIIEATTTDQKGMKTQAESTRMKKAETKPQTYQKVSK